MHKRMEGLAN